MASYKKVVIDGSKLRNELKKRKLSFSDVERECGFGQSAISHYVRGNYINSMVASILNLKYNIKLEDIEIKSEVEEKPAVIENVQPKGFTEEQLNQLHKTIYSAVYEAMKKALNGE